MTLFAHIDNPPLPCGSFHSFLWVEYDHPATETVFHPCKPQENFHHMVFGIPIEHPPFLPQSQHFVPVVYTTFLSDEA
jgi:hypothetical protein